MGRGFRRLNMERWVIIQGTRNAESPDRSLHVLVIRYQTWRKRATRTDTYFLILDRERTEWNDIFTENSLVSCQFLVKFLAFSDLSLVNTVHLRV